MIGEWSNLGKESLVNVEKVEYELKDMAGSIPFETHRIKGIDVIADTLPNYQYHLQNMVLAPNPVAYLRDNLPEEKG